MSIWSTLAGIGGAVAAPFTGGLSLAAGPLVAGLTGDKASNIAGSVAPVLGGAAAGANQGAFQQGQLALGQGNLANSLYQSAMQRAMAQAAMPNFRAQQAVTGDQIANTQDVVPTGPANVMSHVVNFTGGRRPSNLGPNARSAGAALSGIGAANIGKDVLPNVPSMPQMPSGALGNALGGGALGTSLLAAVQKGLQMKPNVAAPQTSPYTGPDYGPFLDQLGPDGEPIDPENMDWSSLGIG